MPIAVVEKIKTLNLKTHIFLIPDACHMAFWTRPEKFIKVLNKILFQC
jgi:hypothetical protein